VVSKNEYNIKQFHDLITETSSRDNFSGNSVEYYTHFLDTLENSKLLLAYYEGNIIA